MGASPRPNPSRVKISYSPTRARVKASHITSSAIVSPIHSPAAEPFRDARPRRRVGRILLLSAPPTSNLDLVWRKGSLNPHLASLVAFAAIHCSPLTAFAGGAARL